jgi:CRP-like cAMP-binding protein
MADDDPILATLRTMAVFADLTDEELDDVTRSIRTRDVKAGKVLIKQGQWGHELLVVLDGEVEVRRDGEVVATQGRGSVVGEVAVLTDARRNASVVTRTAATIGAIEYTQLHALVDTIPVLAERLGDLARARRPG